MVAVREVGNDGELVVADAAQGINRAYQGAQAAGDADG